MLIVNKMLVKGLEFDSPKLMLKPSMEDDRHPWSTLASQSSLVGKLQAKVSKNGEHYLRNST